MSFVRSANPIWFMVDHVGLALNDEYYAFFMQNTLPYLPQVVYQDPDGNIPWSDPIEFQPSGTLPDNLYFDDSKVYRIEIRHGNTQADELIWLIENYIPGGGGSTPIENISINTENVVSNPQFSDILFSSPYTSTASTIQIAPGWALIATGSSGSITITQLEFTGDELIPTNPPYGLEIVSSGWTSVTLRQTFDHNGALWTNEAAAMAFTAKGSSTTNLITGKIVYSDASETTIISAFLTSAYVQYSTAATIPASANPNLPDVAFTNLDISWTSPSTVSITSIQLLGQDVPNAVNYEQIPLERQMDNLFHYYKPGLDLKPIPSFLVGWDFALNPSQFYADGGINGTVAPKAVGANKAYYLWDQTILFQTSDSGVAASRLTKDGSLQLAANVDGQFALIQYLDGNQARNLFVACILNAISAYVGIASSPVKNYTLSLWWTDNVGFPNISAGNTFFTGLDTNGKPSGVIGGWHEIVRLHPGESNRFGNSTVGIIEQFLFPAFQDGAPENASASKFAIVIGTAPLTAANVIIIQAASIVPGTVPTPPAPQSQDEVLRECQYYYRKSFILTQTAAEGVATGHGEQYNVQNVGAASGAGAFTGINFPNAMAKIPAIALYSPVVAGTDVYNFATSTKWTGSVASNISTNGFWIGGTTPGGSAIGNIIAVNWTANALLGTP